MNPKPRDRPVPRSRTILQFSTLPYFSKRSVISRSLEYKLNPNTPRHLLGGGASRSPTWRLRFDIGDLLRLSLALRFGDLDLLRDRDLDRDRRFWTGLRDRLRLALLERDFDREREGERGISLTFDLLSSDLLNISDYM